MVNKERLINSFMDIVRVDSGTLQERKMADFLKVKLEELGLSVTEDNAVEAYGGDAGNVIGVLAGSADKEPLMFLAHMDRVTPGMGIEPILEGNIIKSDGRTILGADNGTGLAAILEMLTVIKENGLTHGRVEVVFTVAEEGGLHGAKGLDERVLQAKKAIVLDSSGRVGTVINQGPAQDGIVARIYGKAAHAGVAPEKGVNAIVTAAKAISRMKIGRLDEETTANIGVIEGGQATNIVPDLVEVRGETRSLSEAKLAEATKGICEEFTQAASENNSRVEIEVKRLYPAYHVAEGHELLQLVKKAANELGLAVNTQPTGGGSDANIINGKGIAAVNLSVGNEEVHTLDEFQRVDDLVRVVEFCLKILELA